MRSQLTAILTLALLASNAVPVLAQGDPAAAEAPVEPPPSFRWRLVGLGGALERAEVREHLEFSFAHGFNGVWVPPGRAGRWFDAADDDVSIVDPAFLEWARECAERSIRLLVSINPVLETDGAFVFGDPEGVRRIRRLIRELGREAGVQDFVLSFRDTPLVLEELGDVVEHGTRSAAPAHLSLARRVKRKLSRRERLWLAPAIASSAGLNDGTIPYAVDLLEGLPTLDRRIGLVWHGPSPVSRHIRGADVDALRETVGQRPIVLDDRFPSGLGQDRLSLALSLAAIQDREAALHEQLAGYLVQPMAELGGSRFALLTIADFLTDPLHYDPKRSWRESIGALGGPDRPRVKEALTTQAMEWGGWIGERNYRSPLRDNPVAVAEILGDPAAVASWSWIERRYPERMQALAGIGDPAFRDDLLTVMSSRLAIARALPTVRELRLRWASGRDDIEPLLAQLRSLRASVAGEPRCALALDRFLAATKVAEVVIEPQSIRD